MKCPNCGADIPKGEVVCPICGYEMQLVPDYHTVDSMLHEKELKDKRAEEERKREREKDRRGRHSHSPAVIRWCLFVLVLTILLGGGLVYLIHQRASSSYFIRKSEAVCLEKKEKYAEAEKVLTALLKENPDSVDLMLLKADILSKEERTDDAVKLLSELIKKDPLCDEAGDQLVRLYISDGQTKKAVSFLQKTQSTALKKKYAEYLPVDPVFSIMSGTYPSGTRLSIQADGRTIYYTTDGKDPDETSLVYDGTPLVLNAGRTVVKAICINKYAVAGEIVTGVYTVKSDAPEAPEITPASGSYESGSQKIRVSVPDGGTVYYTFDGTPSVNSYVYEGPLNMPEGTHIFSAIVIDGAGKPSQVASRTYNVS